MKAHPEFYPIWERLEALGDQTIEIQGQNPIFHTMLHAVQEAQYAANDPPELKPVVQELQQAGFSRLSAMHVVGSVLAMEIDEALTASGPLNERYQARLRLISTNLKDPKAFDARIRRIGRNDPCPCDSGKKFKRCCIDVWPMDLDPNHWLWMLPGGGLYVIPFHVQNAGADDALILLQNLSAVAYGLESLGDLEGVHIALKHMMDIAKKPETLAIAPHSIDNVYWDIVDISLNHPPLAALGLMAVDALLARNDPRDPIEQITMELDRADLLTALNHVDEATAMYAQVRQAVETSDNQEVRDMVDDRWISWQGTRMNP